ncbi:MAG TPA: methylmalonyl-CoA mutase family protein, partial [Gemmatimonadaceae bacterium]|nr:methylmalonyl-CoA mutase family protein [Gemmatimonadaceae bacterium]
EAATLALRTQQVLAHESGVTATVDPLAGSYYVESLTDELERRALALIEHVDSLGGAERAIAAGYFQEEIGRSAYEQQLAIERGESVIVGVNRFADAAPPPVIPSPDYSTLEREQASRVEAARAQRDSAATERALEALRDGATTYRSRHGGLGVLGQAHLMPLIVDAVRARATVGEISDTLESEWGRYR